MENCAIVVIERLANFLDSFYVMYIYQEIRGMHFAQSFRRFLQNISAKTKNVCNFPFCHQHQQLITFFTTISFEKTMYELPRHMTETCSATTISKLNNGSDEICKRQINYGDLDILIPYQ